MELRDLNNRFDYHKPDEEKALRHEGMRAACKALAEYLLDVLPEGREQSLAMTHLEETMFWGNAAIARQQ